MELDDKDQALLADRSAALNVLEGFRVGDWVRFADGVERRVSHIWDDGPQTSDGGHYYLGNGYVSMSGSLYPHVPNETIFPTDEFKDGSVWFFHHDHHRAHNGIDTVMPFRVFTCSREANR